MTKKDKNKKELSISRIQSKKTIQKENPRKKNLGNPFLFFLPILILSTLILLDPTWSDPDSIAHYNYHCNQTYKFEIPILAKQAFKLIPCQINAYKIAQIILLLCTFSAFYYTIKKNNQPTWTITLLTLSGYLIGFLLNFEDDHLAFPIIIIATHHLLKKTTWKKRIAYTTLTLFLTIFVWKGAILPMSIILLSSIQPILGFIPIAYYMIQNGLNNWGNAGEAIIGSGFIIQNILLFAILLTYKKINPRIILTQILTFFQPKWGEYNARPLLEVAEETPKKKYLIFFSLWFLLVFASFITFTHPPTTKMWKIIDKAVEIQKNGGNLVNTWGADHWVGFKKGIPSGAGGNTTRIVSSGDYWLGEYRENCSVIDSDQNFYLQRC